ncbi:MAG: hypothetical protein PUD50_05025, partial [Eubacteriales bacterium]|nr:hypothetical protein [Eubacteriales bacterium]
PATMGIRAAPGPLVLALRFSTVCILRLCRGIFVFFRQFCSDARKWMDGVPASLPVEEENAPACVGSGNIWETVLKWK